MIEIIKVSSKGQVVIPEEVRKTMNIEEGTKLVLIQRNNSIVLEKENDFIKTIDFEKLGWLTVAEKEMNRIWNNKKDDKTWGKYL